MAVTVAVMGADEDDVRRVAAQLLDGHDARPLGDIMRLAFRDPSGGWMLRYEVEDPPADPAP